MEKRKKNFLMRLLLLCTLTLLSGQALSLVALEKSAKKTYFWGGFYLGVVAQMQAREYSGGLLSAAFSLSFQHGKELYSIRYMVATTILHGDDGIQEYSLMYGSRYASAGLGIFRGHVQGKRVSHIGVPLKVQACLIPRSFFLGFSIQAHAFICKHPYFGISLGLQIGKLN